MTWPYVAAEERYVDECHVKQVLSMGKRGEGGKLHEDVTILGLLDRETLKLRSSQRAFGAAAVFLSNCSPREGAFATFGAVLTSLCTWPMELWLSGVCSSFHGPPLPVDWSLGMHREPAFCLDFLSQPFHIPEAGA